MMNLLSGFSKRRFPHFLRHSGLERSPIPLAPTVIVTVDGSGLPVEVPVVLAANDSAENRWILPNGEVLIQAIQAAGSTDADQGGSICRISRSFLFIRELHSWATRIEPEALCVKHYA